MSRDILAPSHLPLRLVTPVWIERELPKQLPILGENPNLKVRHEDEDSHTRMSSATPMW